MRHISSTRSRLLDDLILSEATIADYQQLAKHHYRQSPPRAVTSAYRLVLQAPTIVGRYLSRRDETTTVAVLLRSRPHLCCAMRRVALGNRYDGLSRRSAAIIINDELRTIARVIVHPQWRGLGLATWLARHALGRPETILTESLAAMGRYVPFLERAGMQRFDSPMREESARLLDALEFAGIPAFTLASPSRMKASLNAMESRQSALLLAELQHWFHRAGQSRAKRTSPLQLDDILHAAVERAMIRPVYYLARAED